MAWQETHKEQSKDRILESAAMLFTHHGFEKISIDQVMKNAELTRGAFYSHFSSKSDLYAQAITKAAKVAYQRKPVNFPQDMNNFARYYLSSEHRDNNYKQPCPLAFLVSDINQQDNQVKATYTKTLQAFIDQAETLTVSREKALQSAVLMIGGLALSRALDDKKLSNELLVACQVGVASLSEKEGSDVS
ncbi:TetR/AcrR family transcriptional regulator [Colwellia psychrerythraea]|uniref:Transcriptional regulator, TetR family n=1 Tax=Colwellia psychrerythraea TaxID=28229 RepID=A0A099L3F2_COLPS|nr:TetR/AcrR family transcriptional regulator [Colwellia psychrerythraea]KGJ97489.1 transcriptional regulator, TetR family [Colwellia psychrerythraea]